LGANIQKGETLKESQGTSALVSKCF